MKVKTLTLILSGILFAAVSCKKDDSSVGALQKSCTLNKITYWNGMMPVDVITDSAGNITKYHIYDVIKSGDSVLFRFQNQGTVWYILYDNLKRPIKYESDEGFVYELTYNNAKEQPSKIYYQSPIDSIGTTMLLTYTNNNISQIKWITDTEELNLVVDYYLNRTNKLASQLKLLVPGWKMDIQIPYNFALMFSTNLAKSITSVGTNEGLNYNYEFDGYNNVIKEKLLFGSSDSLVTNYEYLCY
jgi:hypothetical protein